MSRSRKEPKPVQHIELSENNKKLRMILICVLLAVAAVALAVICVVCPTVFAVRLAAFGVGAVAIGWLAGIAYKLQ